MQPPPYLSQRSLVLLLAVLLPWPFLVRTERLRFRFISICGPGNIAAVGTGGEKLKNHFGGKGESGGQGHASIATGQGEQRKNGREIEENIGSQAEKTLPRKVLKVPQTWDTKLGSSQTSSSYRCWKNSHEMCGVRILVCKSFLIFVVRLRLEHVCSGRCSSPVLRSEPRVFRQGGAIYVGYNDVWISQPPIIRRKQRDHS